MKCPCCGVAELIHDTRDMPYIYKGETNTIPAVTGDFCPACGEVVLTREHGDRYSELVGEAFASVWDGIEDTPEAAAEMKRRSALMIALKNRITRAGMTEAQAADLLGVTPSQVSDLIRGKFNLFGLNDLMHMATAAGLTVEL